MKTFLMAAVLVGGIVLAALITRWVNWFAYGENRARREKQKRETDAR
ncbi:MAG: hypothetical protein HZA04_06890 [Nitrospinae bacterium]|nr:hypothetical protein [Nitrospinota bacterium]